MSSHRNRASAVAPPQESGWFGDAVAALNPDSDLESEGGSRRREAMDYVTTQLTEELIA